MDIRTALKRAFSTLKIEVPSNRKGITEDVLIEALSANEGKLAASLGYSGSGDGGFKYFRQRWLPDKPGNNVSYVRFLLHKIDLRLCSLCQEVKIESDFHLDNSDYYKLSCICKICDSKRVKDPEALKLSRKNHYLNNKAYYLEKSARYKANLGRATPGWANLSNIRKFYEKCPVGYHVDHIIPIHGENVCGLHVENNLQYLTAKENLSKGNRFS